MLLSHLKPLAATLNKLIVDVGVLVGLKAVKLMSMRCNVTLAPEFHDLCNHHLLRVIRLLLLFHACLLWDSFSRMLSGSLQNFETSHIFCSAFGLLLMESALITLPAESYTRHHRM